MKWAMPLANEADPMLSVPPRRTVSGALLAVAVLTLFFLTLWLLPKLAPPRSLTDQVQRTAIEAEARRDLAQILGGGFFLLTAYFTWRTVQATERNVRIAQDSLRVSQDNFRLLEKNSERGRRLELYKAVFPERFKRASEVIASARALADEILPKVHLGGNEFGPDFWGETRAQAFAFENLIVGNSWLFGEAYNKVAKELFRVYIDTIHDVDRCRASWFTSRDTKEADRMGQIFETFQSSSQEALKRLSEATQGEIHVKDFDGL